MPRIWSEDLKSPHNTTRGNQFDTQFWKCVTPSQQVCKDFRLYIYLLLGTYRTLISLSCYLTWSFEVKMRCSRYTMRAAGKRTKNSMTASAFSRLSSYSNSRSNRFVNICKIITKVVVITGDYLWGVQKLNNYKMVIYDDSYNIWWFIMIFYLCYFYAFMKTSQKNQQKFCHLCLVF